MILVGRRVGTLSMRWSEWEGHTIEQVVEAMTKKASEASANAGGFDIIEVTVTRRVEIRPQITAVDVSDVPATPPSGLGETP